MATLEEIVEVAEENLDYDLERSVSKCKLLIAALRKIKLRRPRSVTVGDNPVSFNELTGMLERAEAWLSANDSGSCEAGGNSQYYDLSDIRR